MGWYKILRRCPEQRALLSCGGHLHHSALVIDPLTVNILGYVLIGLLNGLAKSRNILGNGHQKLSFYRRSDD